MCRLCVSLPLSWRDGRLRLSNIAIHVILHFLLSKEKGGEGGREGDRKGERERGKDDESKKDYFI